MNNFLTLPGPEISVDLPAAQRRWCGAAEIDRVKVLSDHRDLQFAEAYGVWIKEFRLLARSILVVDHSGKEKYVQYVKDSGSEPDYEKALTGLSGLG
jgi:thiol peroxidase